MDQFIPDYPCTYLIYGNIHSGKTTIVRELMNILNVDNQYAITTSIEDYEDIITNTEYKMEELDAWIKIPEDKLLILDDFLHVATENGKVGRHLKSLITTTRKRDKRLNIVISAHVLAIGKYVRSCASVFILFKVDEDSEKIMKQFLPIDQNTINNIRDVLINQRYTFLILDTGGQWQLMRLEQ